jgi:hypothetical protein
VIWRWFDAHILNHDRLDLPSGLFFTAMLLFIGYMTWWDRRRNKRKPSPPPLPMKLTDNDFIR